MGDMTNGSPPTTRPTDRPVGRRPGDPATTKATILEAARTRFSEVGFDRATIRSIATSADVDPALVIHHFGGKRQLFVAAHELPFDPAELLADIDTVPSNQRGAHICRLYLSMMVIGGSPAVSLLRTAATNDNAAEMLRQFITSAFISHAPTLAPGPEGERRLALAGAQMMGVVFGREVLKLEPLATATINELVDAIAPTIQRYLDEPLHGDAP